jgi:tetratricopeptide (TPR) repeat protein
MRATRIVAAILWLAPFLSSGAAAEPRADVEVEARTDFAAGRYREALEIYAGLFARTQHPTYMRNIGRCYQKLGQPDDAIDRFREYLRLAGPIDDKSRQEVEGFIAEMEALKRSRQPHGDATRPTSPPSGATPPHLEARPEALEQDERSAGRPEALLQSTPPSDQGEPSAPFYKRWYFWTAIAAIAAGGVVTVMALSRSPGPQAPNAMPELGIKDAKP